MPDLDATTPFKHFDEGAESREWRVIRFWTHTWLVRGTIDKTPILFILL
jgi:hypothetical protein